MAESADYLRCILDVENYHGGGRVAHTHHEAVLLRNIKRDYSGSLDYLLLLMRIILYFCKD